MNDCTSFLVQLFSSPDFPDTRPLQHNAIRQEITSLSRKGAATFCILLSLHVNHSGCSLQPVRNENKMSRDMTKPTKWLCAQRRLRSAWASAQSDQSLRCPHEESLGPQLPIKRTANNLIRLGECSGWSESSLGALILFVLSCRGSLMIPDYEWRFKEKLTSPHLSRLMTKPTNWHCPSEDSDQPGHRPSLIDVFAMRSEGSLGPRISSCGQRRLWSDWAHRAFCWFCRDAAHFLILINRVTHTSLPIIWLNGKQLTAV